jgi:hypothetical protein
MCLIDLIFRVVDIFFDVNENLSLSGVGRKERILIRIDEGIYIFDR